MIFNSYHFLIFFPLVLLVFFVIPRKLRTVWLLIASYYFYMCWNPRYALLIAFSTLVTFISGRLIGRVNSRCDIAEARARRQKQWIVAASLLINLGILILFKYSGFLITNLNLVMRAVHLAPIPTLDVLLPVGISFYTFQALSYTVDVYRGDILPEKSLIRYALFVSFFPQLVAGPIERSKNLLSQIDQIESLSLWNFERFTGGLMLMVWGFFQKVVIADRLALFVDQVFYRYAECGTVELVAGAVLFAFQIYCDFGGYSMIAIGAAKAMGFTLMENFNTPYFALSVKEFWSRWHISLSSWFRDYVYIPLGGNRCARWKKYRNVMMTFLVSGLWHGASWSFVIWGALHGFYQIVGDLLAPLRKKLCRVVHLDRCGFVRTVLRLLTTFVLVDIAWIFFRMNSITASLRYILRMFTVFNPEALANGSLFGFGLSPMQLAIAVRSLLVLLAVDLVRRFKGETLDVFLRSKAWWLRWLVLILLIMAIVLFGIYGPAYNPAQFIYFQF